MDDDGTRGRPLRAAVLALGAALGLTVLVLVLVAATTGGFIVRDDAGCPRSLLALPGSVDWADVVRVSGVEHAVVGDTGGPTDVAADEVGDELLTVRCRVADTLRSTYRVEEGEATLLPVGTTVHEVVGPDGAAVDGEVVAVLPGGDRLRYRALEPVQ